MNTERARAATLIEALRGNTRDLIDLLFTEPEYILEKMNEAARTRDRLQQERRAAQERAELMERVSNPFRPRIEHQRNQIGSANADIRIFAFEDFQCPFTRKGWNSVQEVFERFPQRVQFKVRHLPLDFHDMADTAARYFEALTSLEPGREWEFREALLKGEVAWDSPTAMESILQSMGIDAAKVADRIMDDFISETIASDVLEAHQFGITGTPGYIVNGIPIKGAYGAETFEEMIALSHAHQRRK
jgi:2-hydroxychromene-2-carboxylate isomerase